MEPLPIPPLDALIGNFFESIDRTVCRFVRELPEFELHLYECMYAHVKSPEHDGGRVHDAAFKPSDGAATGSFVPF